MDVKSLLSKLIFAVLAFPPIYILVRYLRWCAKETGKPCASKED